MQDTHEPEGLQFQPDVTPHRVDFDKLRSRGLKEQVAAIILLLEAVEIVVWDDGDDRWEPIRPFYEEDEKRNERDSGQ